LRPGIARGRSCASVLVVPQRKPSLVEALHERRPWLDLSSMDGSHGELGGRGREEKGKRGEQQWAQLSMEEEEEGGAVGGAALGGLGPMLLLFMLRAPT
jgi:hypothetical protein